MDAIPVVATGEPPVIDGNIAHPDTLRGERGRFAKGVSGNPRGRYEKGQSGNPQGRPRGTRSGGFKSPEFRAGMRRATAVLDKKAPALMRMAIAQAVAGDPVAVRFCLGRILGTRRGQPVELDLPPVARARDLSGVVAAITGAVAAGRVTPDEAHALSRMLAGLPGALAAAGADQPAWSRDGGEDPRKTLARKLARLAKGMEEKAPRRRGDAAPIAGPGDHPALERGRAASGIVNEGGGWKGPPTP